MNHVTSRVLRLAPAMALLASTSCTYVSLTPAAESVELTQAAAVTGCEQVGTASASTRDRVWMFARSAKKIRTELSTLARNEAVKLGGNTVVPSSEIQEGKQSFDVYLCQD